MRISFYTALLFSGMLSAVCARAEHSGASTSQSTPARSDDQSIDKLASGLSWIEDEGKRQQVIAFAKAGQPSLVYNNREDCPAGQADALGGSDHCLKHTKLPGNVLQDVMTMNRQRFDNSSDYDQRITKLYTFKYRSMYRFDMDYDTVGSIAEALNIPSELIRAFNSKTYEANDSSYLSMLKGLYINGDFQDETSLSRHLASVLSGKKVRLVSFGPDEIGLYPGGGFGITFYLLITNEDIVYIKNEGWNS